MLVTGAEQERRSWEEKSKAESFQALRRDREEFRADGGVKRNSPQAGTGTGDPGTSLRSQAEGRCRGRGWSLVLLSTMLRKSAAIGGMDLHVTASWTGRIS
uniref:Uncharacterized protein n=1 Tax=Sphaerodactylus townsendi TaxID=933632 RepID=A0ACB8G708_9SAUR